MYTLCSHCQAEYEVAPELLVRGRGWLHCSACERDFDALGNLSKTPRTATVPPLALPSHAHEQTIAPEDIDVPPVVEAGAMADAVPVVAEAMESDLPEDERPEDAPSEPQHSDAGQPNADPPVVDAPDADRPEDHQDEGEEAVAGTHDAQPPAASEAPSTPPPIVPAPSFAKHRTRIPVAAVRRGQRWRWAAITALALLLLVQVALADRERYAADARTRPWLEKLCGVLACELPPWREPAAMQLMARDVRPHPSAPDALIISASFRNEARWAQPWPDLKLTLSDINGQTIAQRQFEPGEYLGLGARKLTIEPSQTASVTLEVADPGKQAVAFEFEFR